MLLDLDSRDDTPVGVNKMDLPIMKDLNELPQQPPTKAPTKKIADPVLPSFNGDSQRGIVFGVRYYRAKIDKTDLFIQFGLWIHHLAS